MVERRTLTPLILVRVQVPQPNPSFKVCLLPDIVIFCFGIPAVAAEHLECHRALKRFTAVMVNSDLGMTDTPIIYTQTRNQKTPSSFNGAASPPLRMG